MANELRITTLKELRIITDPYRQAIIRAMKRLGKPATSKEIAVAMGQSPSKVYYHLGLLEALGIVRLDHTQVINGITARYLTVAGDPVKIKIDDKEYPEAEQEFVQMARRHFDEAREEYINNMSRDKEDGCNLLFAQTLKLTPAQAAQVYDYIVSLPSEGSGECVPYQLFAAFCRVMEDE